MRLGVWPPCCFRDLASPIFAPSLFRILGFAGLWTPPALVGWLLAAVGGASPSSAPKTDETVVQSLLGALRDSHREEMFAGEGSAF